MHVIVLGAGIAGVTTAWYLARSGCRVTVIDKASSIAAGTSHANAAQLSYSFVDSLATPEFLPRIPAMLFGRHHGAHVGLDAELVTWGLQFIAQCTPGRSARAPIRLLELANDSARLLADLLEAVPLEFDFRPAGKIVLLPDASAVRQARAGVELKRRHGSDVDVLGIEEALSVEPTLADMNDSIAGVVYSATDNVGDACRFARGLGEHLEDHYDVCFRMNTNVDAFALDRSRIAGIRAGEEEVRADAVVVCLGTSSRRLAATLGIRLPIIPVRGYSVTLPVGSKPPVTSVTSLEHHFVYTRLGDRIRIAGFTDFRGYSTQNDGARVRDLLDIARRSAPHSADYDVTNQHAWGGFRPMTPDSLPRVGKTARPGLYLNTGHGMLGWTLAPATARRVADAITDDA
jgi:D-amino-acid dehydrogenase